MTRPVPELKPCPFCGGQANIECRSWENPNGFEYGSHKYFVVICSSCKSHGTEIICEHFNGFSAYTVKEFNANNALRSHEEQRYEIYKEQQKAKSIDAWNTRAGDAK